MDSTSQGLADAYGQVAAQRQRDALVLDHLPLVRHVIGRLMAQLPASIDQENLESAGVLGLVEAAASFDRERGTQFSTYAYARIRGAVLDELRRNCPLPQHMLERLARVRKAYAELPAPVSVEALSAATGLSLEEVADSLAAFRMTRTVSWDDRVERSIGTRLDLRQEAPEARLEQEEQCLLLTEALEALPERECLAVTLYYHEDLRLKEIAALLELSESRVSRLLNAALFHLGEYLRSKGR